MKKIRINTNIYLQLKTSKKQMRCIEAPISVILVKKILKDFGEKIKKNDYVVQLVISIIDKICELLENKLKARKEKEKINNLFYYEDYYEKM